VILPKFINYLMTTSLNHFKKEKLPPCYTEKFRDLEVWDSIKTQLLPKLVNNHIVRVWSAGCASGEETFSLASLFQQNTKKQIYLSIYGTDIREDKLKEAKTSLAKKPRHYRLPSGKNINIRFKSHNLVTDKPVHV